MMFRDVAEFLRCYPRHGDRILGFDRSRATLNWLQKCDLADVDTSATCCHFLAIHLDRNVTGENETEIAASLSLSE